MFRWLRARISTCNLGVRQAVLATVAGAALTVPIVSQETGASTASARLPEPYVLSFSGSPLLMEIGFDDPQAIVAEVEIESGVSSQRYRIPADATREPLQLRVSPFLGSGAYELAITLRDADGGERHDRLDVGFVDFVWGRDNLSFGNNSEYESVIGTFGEILSEWIGDRFGEVSEAELVLLIDYMYGLFGSNTGRCYAFAGTEVRYWRWPELLPTYYDAAHDLRGTVARYQREMNFLQFDIVFNHFLAGPGSTQIGRPMTRDEMAEQVELVIGSVKADEPVAVGFAGPDLHHSMLVFGYIVNPARETVDLLVANNWKSDEKLNIHSRDAEIIRVHLGHDYEGDRVEWRYEDGVRNRAIDRFFVVDVRRDEYVHDRALLDGLLAGLGTMLRNAGRAIVVVEEAAGARLTDGSLATGRLGYRSVEELEGVWYERVGRTYRFTYPAELALDLEVGDDAGARVLVVRPAAGHVNANANRDPDAGSVDAADGGEPVTGVQFESLVVETDAPADGETVTRRISLLAPIGPTGRE